MRRMIIFKNVPDLHKMLGGEIIYFTTTEEDFEKAMQDRDIRLALGQFEGSIPTCTRVEVYVKREDLTGSGPGGNDYVFLNGWTSPISRQEAIEKYYRVAKKETYGPSV